MYEEFFEMQHTPFSRYTPVDKLYEDPDTDEIYNRLVYAAHKQLFALLSGDAGSGKTTALRRLRETLNAQEYAVLYAGHPNPIFSDDAMKLIFNYSSGIPRLINRACSQSLIYAYQNRRSIIDDRMVQIVLAGEVA